MENVCNNPAPYPTDIPRPPPPNIIYIPAFRAQNDQPEEEDLLRK